MRVGWRAVAGASLLLAIATIVLTWPLLRLPATTVLDTPSLYGDASVLIQRDINLTMWTLAWDTHALLTRPLHLFHANAFHPAPYSLAFSEHKLGNVPLFAPVYLASGNPVLAHQFVLLAIFVLAGLAMAAYVLYWTADGGAALASAFFFAFAPFRFWQLGSIDYISIHFLPMIALGVDAILDRRLGRTGPLAVGVGLVFSSFCSYYVGYAAFVLAALYATVGVAARGRESVAQLPRLAVPVAGAAGIVAVVSIPYVILQHRGILPDYGQRGFTGLAFLGMVRFGATGLLSYYVLPRRGGVPEFLTYTGLSLAVLALLGHRRHPRGALVAVGVTGAVLGLGPYVYLPGLRVPLPYRLLVWVVPGFSAMRVPHRFGALTTFATMALAGLGLAALRSELAARGRRRLGAVLAVLTVAAFLAEATPRGLRAMPQPTCGAIPPAYRWLATHGDGGPLLELPTYLADLYRESLRMYYSTFHWLPLVNGYTPYPPQSYVDVMTAAERLPEPEALQAILARVPVRWVLFHRRDVKLGARREWDATLDTALQRVGDFGGDVLYDVRR